MQRNPQQITLDRLLVRAAVAKIPLEQLLNDKEREELAKIQKKITPDTKKDIIPGLDAIVDKLKKGLNTPEVAAKIIANFKSEGALGQKKALEYIYPQDPKLVIPVITHIIEDLQESVMKRNPLSPTTLEFVRAALAKVKEVDEKQNRNKVAQVPLIKELKKETIGADMMPIFAAVSKITFLEDEILKWFEATLWIEGHFLREHMKALSKGGGKLTFIPEDPEVVAPIDDEDETICYGKGVPFWDGNKVTKHYINSHFHVVAVLLEQKARADFRFGYATIDVYPTKFVEQFAIKQAALAAEPEKKEERKPELESAGSASLIFMQPGAAYDTKKSADGKWLQVTTYVPADCPPERIAEGMRFFSKAVKGEPLLLAEPQAKESLLSRLKYSKWQNVADKDLFGFMIMALNECMLTGREDDIIHSHMSTFEVTVDQNYTKASRSGYKFRLYGDRAHVGDVTAMFAYFKSIDEKGKRKTALEIIAYMQTVWEKANKDASTLLYAVLEELIREMRDKLILHLDSGLQSATSMSVSLSTSVSSATPRMAKH